MPIDINGITVRCNPPGTARGYKPRTIDMRICFECKKIILFVFFRDNAIKSGFSYKQALKIWSSKYVQLYCCDCIQDLKFMLRLSKEIKKSKENNYGGFKNGNSM